MGAAETALAALKAPKFVGGRCDPLLVIDRDEEHDDCASWAGRTAAHRGEPVTANPYPEPPPGTSNDDLYDYDHTLWAFGHQLGAQEPGGVPLVGHPRPPDHAGGEGSRRADAQRDAEAFLAMPHCPECDGTGRCHDHSEPDATHAAPARGAANTARGPARTTLRRRNVRMT